MTEPTISEHGIIGNMRSAALVNIHGEIDFFCYPEFDSPTVFASLLDGSKGGGFSLRPLQAASRPSQIYLPDTNVLLTRFLSDFSVLEVCDFMPVGNHGTPHCILRKVTAVLGNAEVVLHCKPAFNYAREAHTVKACPGGVRFAPESGAQPMLLLGSLPLQFEDGAATAQFQLQQGESVYFQFGVDESRDESPEQPDATGEFSSEAFCAASHHYFQHTCDYWKRWAKKSTYKGRWREAVTRSALTLKLLTSSEHGSIVAAPTFGLPETLGGIRNWDYRYVWMRDASFTLYAFNRLGYIDEGLPFQKWLEERLHLGGERGPIDVMYRIDGTDNLDEIELPHLAGFRSSRPVRIGNGAAKQTQLDIYGELFDAAYLAGKYSDGVSYQGWNNMKAVLRWLADHWRDPDEGIWEVRGGPREFLHSRLMCWVAFDRALRLGVKRSLAGPYEWMEQCRDAIVNDIHENFWDADLGTFVQYKGAKHVDASTLLMPLLRFISPSDPRWLSTLKVIERELATDTVVRRYSTDNLVDGLEGREGGFVACAFWLVEAKARSHQMDEACLLFEKLLSQANPLGLFAEELDASGQHLGNFPQALSHLALISAATYLDRRLNTSRPEPWS
jgi:GH15 family glucan-1,4-alpha-glucosidase